MKTGLEQLCGNRICVSLEDITKNNGVTRRGLVLEEKGGGYRLQFTWKANMRI